MTTFIHKLYQNYLKVQNKILMRNQLKQLNEIDRLKNAVLKEKNINQVSINLTVSFLLYSLIPPKKR